ncbi:hypothetical protein ACHAQH_009557 [Verticillium albo-atrum]
MSLFDLAAKFGGLSTQESDDHEGYTGPRDYGYTQTSAYESGYNGSPPTGYPSGPQQGQAEYKQSHDGYSTSDPTRASGQEGAYAAPPSADEYHPQSSDFDRGDRPVSPALPEGWIKRFDERHGKWYYVDDSTGTSQWEPPKRSFEDGGDDGSRQAAHASQEQVYDAHSGAGEAAGYYAGHQYGQNAPVYGQIPADDPYAQRSGAPYGQGYYGGEQHRSGVEEERKSSGYGGALLGVAGGLAVGAMGGALIANAMQSDSEPEAEDPPADYEYRSHHEPVDDGDRYVTAAAYEEDRGFDAHEEEEKESSDTEEEESQEDSGSSDSEDDEEDHDDETQEEDEEHGSHESSDSDSGDDDGSGQECEEQDYASGSDGQESGQDWT